MAGSAVTLTSGPSATATTTATFTAQTAGVVLVLVVSSDDYRTTTGTGRPESTGWTPQSSGQDFLGHYVWTKVSTGSETSVQYTIGSAVNSAFGVIAISGLDTSGTLLDGTPGVLHTHGGSTTATPSVTPSAGARYALACFGAMSASGQITGSIVNSGTYTEVLDAIGPNSASKEAVAGHTLSLTGGSATSSTAGWQGASDNCSYGSILVFKEATGGATNYNGTASLAATATTTAAGTVGKATGASVAATGSISTAGTVGTSAGASIAATATISAAGSVTTGTSSGAALAAVDSITAAGVVGTSSGGSLAATVNTTAGGVVGASAGASLAATATISAGGIVGLSAGATLSETATITTGGSVLSGASGSATLAETATITAAGTLGVNQGAALSATATITASGSVASGLGATLAATAVISAAGTVGEAISYFTPPTVEAHSSDQFMGRWGIPVGQSVVRIDGVFQLAQFPWIGELIGAEGTDWFLGGRTYPVGYAVATELVDAGFQVEGLPTPAGGFGVGGYGTSGYGI